MTGVDNSELRLSVARNVLRKYEARRVRLFLGSGLVFGLLAPPSAEETQLEKAEAQRQGRPTYSYQPVALRVLKVWRCLAFFLLLISNHSGGRGDARRLYSHCLFRECRGFRSQKVNQKRFALVLFSILLLAGPRSSTASISPD